MPTPTNRTPVRVARGTFTNLNTNKADIQEGEICFATDTDKLYVKEGSNLTAATVDISGKANLTGATFTGDVSFEGEVIAKGDSTAATSGQITLNCENNSHGVKIKGPPHSAGASYTLQLPDTVGSANNLLKVDGAGHLDWLDSTSLLPLTGGTLTGDLTLSGNPTANNHAANKAYIDTSFGNALPLAGGTLTGDLTLSGAPTSNLHAVTKLYVDTTSLPLAGGTLTGNLTLSGAPTADLHAATKKYTDDTFVPLSSWSGITEAS